MESILYCLVGEKTYFYQKVPRRVILPGLLHYLICQTIYFVFNFSQKLPSQNKEFLSLQMFFEKTISCKDMTSQKRRGLNRAVYGSDHLDYNPKPIFPYHIRVDFFNCKFVS